MEEDAKVGKQFLKCEANRFGDSYRSPWTNEYIPPTEDAKLPSPNFRDLELKAQPLFEEYKRLYYEGGISSVYINEIEEPNKIRFQFMLVVKKGCLFSACK